MFSKISRYNKLDDLLSYDRKGQSQLSKGIRMIENAEGVVLHTIEDGDRLDHLSYKYYKQSRHWWRICDANRDYHSPIEMLGKTSLKQCLIPMLGDEEIHPYPWVDLFQFLLDIQGVEKVSPDESIEIVPDESDLGHPFREVFQRSIKVNYNEHLITHWDLAEKLGNEGYSVGDPKIITRIGKSIAIPSSPIV